jgi:integrase
MLATYKFVFNRKKQRLSKGETALVQLRITISRKVRFFSTGIYIEKNQWTGTDKAWITNCENAKDYNDFLNDVLVRVRSEEIKALQRGGALNHEVITNLIKGNDMSVSFIDFIKTDSAKRNDISEDTRKQVIYLAKKLERFGIVNFSDLTLKNIQYAHYELIKEGKKESTVHKFHATVAVYIARAIRLDLFQWDKNPYLKFKTKRPRYADRKYLTQEELIQIEQKEFSIPRLQFVRDAFIFSCYTGLAYSDLTDLLPANIVEEHGREFIKTHRIKTDERALILLLAKAKEILKKYEGQREGFCFPAVSNQKMNAYLKEIADLSGISQNLTFHMARHTFATTVMLRQGVSLEVTQKALGHSDIKTTQIYAKMVDTRVAEEMGKLDVKTS